MTRDEMIQKPSVDGPVRILGKIDADALIESLAPFVQKARDGVKQQGLRWAGDFEGVSDLRYSDANPRRAIEEDFINWQPGTEMLQSIAKEFGIRDAGRVRMLTMTPKTTYSFHHDPDLWRVHIPLITNINAFMIVEGKLWHLEKGNVYLVKVQHHHLALNAGDDARTHIVFDWCDNLA